MTGLVIIRFVLGILFLLAATVFFIIQVLGVFKMKYVLNRMHLAAIGDALALGLATVGIVLLNGLNFTTFKLLLVPCFVFFTSPVSSHLISRMEVATTPQKDKYRVTKLKELEAEKGEE